MDLTAVLEGVNQGLLQGLGAYKTAREMQIQQKYAQGYQQNQQAGLLQKGMQTDENGQVSYNPEQQKQIDYERSVINPESDRSNRSRALTQGLLEKIGPQYAGLISPEMSAKEIEGNPYIQDVVKGEFQKQGRELSNQ